MKHFSLYFLIGILFVFIQSSVLPLFFSPNLRPNLILIFVLYLGLSESTNRAIIAGLLLGAIQDSFCGHSLGLYVSVYLIIVISTRVLSEQMNTESSALLLVLIAGGTILQNLLVAVFLSILADTEPVLRILLPAIPQQLLANLLSSALFLFLLFRFQRLVGQRPGLAGLIYQSKYHGL
ncbi:MAG: rod shape-determining protein MreD [Deltaproteobacteria bacterium]|nr:rod shape-determining protein MreD [Deltaproteobacteria bacterium]MCW8891811.1 rod shape-determining protein MreD [Deltaproteobacteria bacterium]